MTGVAAQMCGDRDVVVSLGYQVKPDGTILQEETDEDGKKIWKAISKLGARKAVLNDLSPAATFIAYNYNTPVDVHAFEKEAKRILAEVEDECGWMYETYHTSGAGFQPAKKIYEKEKAGTLHQNAAAGKMPALQLKGFKQTKRNLPHWQYPGAIIFVTFNTYNRLSLREEAKDEVLSALKYWDGSKIKLFSAVIMDDHVHAVFKLLQDDTGNSEDLSQVMHSIKSYSANKINTIMSREGILWQNESYDHIIRDENDFHNTLSYIWYNPVKKGLCEIAEEYAWYYRNDDMKDAGWKPALLGKINYTVWSDVFVCPECANEVVFWEVAVDKDAGKVRDAFQCPHCHAELTKRKMERAWVTKFDSALNDSIKQAKQIPVLINYSVESASSRRGKRFEKVPDEADLALIGKIENSDIPYWYPTYKIPTGEKTPETLRIGITHQHHLYQKRNLWITSCLFSKLKSKTLKLAFQSVVSTLSSKLVRYNFGNRGNGILTGTIYVPSLNAETIILKVFAGKVKDFSKALKVKDYSILNNGSCSNLQLKSSSVDYIFIDPPFGANLQYSELNLFWEGWLSVFTNNTEEAIESRAQKKGSIDYRSLMAKCFNEAYRTLKPGRWMTVEFSNTKASVWNSIQTALTEAGFIVANVSALDKKQGSFNAVSNPTSVKQDLVISAYKPNGGFEERFEQEAQTEEGIWDFIRTHLKYLPLTKKQGLDLVAIPERDPRILYDQVIAYYVRKGYNVPIDSQEFQFGLSQRFSERDGMYFLPEQVAEYDRKKMIGGGRQLQQSLFISDEASAIEWLRSLLRDKPQSFQDINPLFMKEISGWSKNEVGLELSTLLEQNFLLYDGKGPVPDQIHSYLSTNWKDMRNLPKEDPALVAKAKGRWYVPDPNKAGDLEKLREKALLKEFEEYKQAKKKLKIFRLEAVRAGFKKAWQERDYALIVAIAEKIPTNILEEDPKLLMWYDQAITRMDVK